MKKLTLAAIFAASPALAASGPFFSLGNTDFVVLLAFIVFIGVLVYFKVPGMITGILDKRAESITADLNEARALREEAQTVLASYERKQAEVQEQADRIVAHAKEEAAEAARQAQAELQRTIERRLTAAEEQLASAQASAVREVKDRAVQIAVQVAGEVISAKMTAVDGNQMIEDSIKTVDAKLH
ncbi:MAG: F0F1 ATP synthase subunit B [Rhodobacteraceae bacterium]|nr:F0F1 ATP synthase subunit B [Paracoccaceae bacterium]